MKLHASDGVFMAQNLPSSVGASAVRKAYETVFKNIKLSVKFNVAEVVQVAPESRPPAQATMAKRSSREHRLDGPRGSGDGGRGLPQSLPAGAAIPFSSTQWARTRLPVPQGGPEVGGRVR
jgi:hypothetical protein